MKKFLVCASLLLASMAFAPVDAIADVRLTNYYAFSGQQPENMSRINLYDLCRDDYGRLYCYYKNAQGQLVRVSVLKVRGREGYYQVEVEGQVFQFFLDPQAMSRTERK